MKGPKLEPLIFTIFGASGDLAKRKLVPALFDLYKRRYLPPQFALLGVGRTPLSDQDFRDSGFLHNEFLNFAGVEDSCRHDFASRMFYQPIDTANGADFAKLKARLIDLDQKFSTQGNIIFYLSTPPSLYATIPEFLAQQGLNAWNGSFRRLVVEKPFGSDLESACQLNRTLRHYFDEENIYRIDHYLGKETVQNLLVTRFANGIFEPLWNRNYIHHVEITSAEDIGVGSRGGYYDQSGALRDMLQNHLLQLVAHTAMEPPIRPDAVAIRNEKNKLLQALRPLTAGDVSQNVIRGQYIASKMRGEQVSGYREEEGVAPDSRTETYVAMKFFIDNWRWYGVPFYVRTGKRLPTRVAEITITFKRPPQLLFRRESDIISRSNNQLVIRIQPDEGLLLNFGIKSPGERFEASNVSMDFRYTDLTETDIPDAYERLLLDCMKGDSTLYAHGESVESSWKFVSPILEAWQQDPDIPIFGYPAGSWGPLEADRLIESTEIGWRNPCRRLTSDTSYCEL